MPALTCLYQEIGALAGQDQVRLHRFHGAELDAVIGDCMQFVLLELEQHVVLVTGVHDAPALDLAGPHGDGRPALTVDREETGRGLGEQGLERLDHAALVEDHLGQDQHALLGVGDLGHLGEVALDDDHADHAACHLDVGAAVMVRVVPVGALWCGPWAG